MSRTIETISGSDFDTNIFEEDLIGLLCELCGVKHPIERLDHPEFGLRVAHIMPYSMTEEESKIAADRFRYYADKVSTVPDNYFHFYSVDQFKEVVHKIAEKFEMSKGYTCI